MTNYRVTWTVDVEDVTDATHAALSARAMALRPDTWATVYSVTQDGSERPVQVDLRCWDQGTHDTDVGCSCDQPSDQDVARFYDLAATNDLDTTNVWQAPNDLAYEHSGHDYQQFPALCSACHSEVFMGAADAHVFGLTDDQHEG